LPAVGTAVAAGTGVGTGVGVAAGAHATTINASAINANKTIFFISSPPRDFRF
jgi:hypothetical protein